MKNAYLYLRSARDDDSDTLSVLLEQERALKNWAGHNGYKVIGVYVDKGVSGTTVNRPSLRQLISVCASDPADAVLVSDYSRLGRNIVTVSKIVKTITSMGVGIIDISNPEEFVHESFVYKLLCITNDYYKKLHKKV